MNERVLNSAGTHKCVADGYAKQCSFNLFDCHLKLNLLKSIIPEMLHNR